MYELSLYVVWLLYGGVWVVGIGVGGLPNFPMPANLPPFTNISAVPGMPPIALPPFTNIPGIPPYSTGMYCLATCLLAYQVIIKVNMNL